MENEFLLEFWQIVKQYLSNKDKQLVADHVINSFVELGMDDNDLNDFSGIDSYMANAVRDHLDNNQDEDE